MELSIFDGAIFTVLPYPITWASCPMTWGFLPQRLRRLAPWVGQDAPLATISDIPPHKRMSKKMKN